MSLSYAAVKTNSIIWRNIELPHPSRSYKSPDFCLDEIKWYFQVNCSYGGNNELFQFTLRRSDNSRLSNYVVIPYIESKGKYVRIASTIEDTNISRYDIYKVVGNDIYSSDIVTILFSLSRDSLNTEQNFKETPVVITEEDNNSGDESIQSQCLETVSIQPINIANNIVCPCSCSHCGKESIQTLCLKDLSEDIEKLFNDVESADTTLKCDDKSFSVHRKILAARSEVFSAMFKHDLAEKNSGIVNIEDLDSNFLEPFLRYLYSGRIEFTSVNVALELYQAAEKYSVRTLKQLCASYIRENLSKDIVFEVLNLADKAGDVEFMDGITSSAVKIEGFLKSAEWDEFAEKFPNLAVKVYSKYIKQMT